MRNSLSVVYDFVNKHTYLILLTLFVIWILVGVFPPLCYEADGMEITLGCEIMYREGWSFPPIYSYEYRMQPLITILIVALRHLLPFFTCEQIYCLFTALSSVIFLIGCVEFGRHIVKTSRIKILIATMLLPEMYAIAMYSNSAIPSAACFIWALLLITRQKYWQSIMLMCIGVWFRIDIVTVYPVLLPLLYYEGFSFKKIIGISSIYAVFIVGISVMGFWLMNAEALGTFGSYERWSDIITPILRFYAIYGFYSLSYFILLPIGICVIAFQKRWKELFLVLLPILLLHIVMAEFGNASKHFLYNAPFVIIAGVYALLWLEEKVCNRPILKWMVVGLALLFFTVSIRRKQLDIPWLQKVPLHNVGIVASLTSINLGNSDVVLAIGAGPQVITRDEYMLGSGHFFYSWYIHCIKCIMEEWRFQQKIVLDKAPSANILTLEYSTAAPLVSKYLSEGYHFRLQKDMPNKYYYTIYNKDRYLHYWRVYLTEEEHSSQKVLSYIDSLSQVFPKGDDYIMSSLEHFGTERFLDEIAETGRIEKKAPRLYKIVNQKKSQ